MWYLARNLPKSLDDQTKDLLSFTSRNSIFPVSNTGIFEEISVVQVPDKPIDQDPHPNGPWEWFARQSSHTQFQAMVVPQVPILTVQIITQLPITGEFLCTLVVPTGHVPVASLCTYSPQKNQWKAAPKMKCRARNPASAAVAVLDGWLYVGGGHLGSPSHPQGYTFLQSAERLDLRTGEWQKLPNMQAKRPFAVGVAHRGKFYVVGGDRSAEVYDPVAKEWQFMAFFVPKEAEGFAMGSVDGQLVMFTWSDLFGSRIWRWLGLDNENIGRWRLIGYLPDQKEALRARLKQNGARLVRVGRELWVVEKAARHELHIDGICAWPTFPGPTFWPGDGLEVVAKGCIYAFSFSVGGRLVWRRIPVYSV